MDYVRGESPAKATPGRWRKIRHKLRTGPLPSVPWRELDRRSSIENHLPLLIVLAFAFLAGIQLLLAS